MTVEIPLTKGMVALVDDEDFALVASQGKWQAAQYKSLYYARRTIWVAGSWGVVRMHNLITGLEFVDHHNGNGLDNRRKNLRAANRSNNGHNASRRSDNTSGFKGVCRHRQSGKWAAAITVRGERVHLGLHEAPELAAQAYDMAAIQRCGDFARTNFPKESYR
jgi:hypothetical protein